MSGALDRDYRLERLEQLWVVFVVYRSRTYEKATGSSSLMGGVNLKLVTLRQTERVSLLQ